MIDGGLAKLFAQHMPKAHWQRIETGGTGRGIPDLNGCLTGTEVWVECKNAKHWQVSITPEQVAWIERRARAGGRVFVAVRRAADELWLLAPAWARFLCTGHRLDKGGHEGVVYLGAGGPARWSWADIENALFTEPFMYNPLILKENFP